MKKLIALISSLLLALPLSGCMDISLSYEVDNKGNCTQEAKMLFDNALIQKETDASIDDYLSEMKDAVLAIEPGLDVSPIQEENKSGLSLGGLPFLEPIIEKQGNTYTFILDLATARQILAEEAEYIGTTVEDMKQQGVLFHIYVTMPGKPKANVGSVENKTVAINLLDSTEDTATITCTRNNLLLPVLTALLAVGILTLLRRLFKR